MGRLLSRRRLLATGALGSVSAAVLSLPAGRAVAFTVQPMDAQTHALYLSACGGADARTYHAKLLADAKERLAGTMSAQEIDAALAQLTCPICGCSLAAG